MNKGIWIAPVTGLILYLLPLSISPEAHRMLGVLGLTSVLWVTEALPLPVTAILAAVLVILFGIGSASDVFGVFVDPLLFLFIGSFMLAEAMQVHGLDRRFAHTVLRNKWVRASAGRMIFIYACISFAISMWVSNTATTAMMYPIGLSIIRVFSDEEKLTIAPLILLMTSFGASIGGMATPVGTPPNLIGLGLLKEITGESVRFATWMSFAFPTSVVVFLCIFMLMRSFLSHGVLNRPIQELAEEEMDETRRRGQRNVAIAFLVTVFLWLLPSFAIFAGGDADWWEARLPESVAALIGTVLLFLLPISWKDRQFTITWKQAQNINWGIILLFGGGLVVGKFLFKTGVANYIGDSLSAMYPFSNELMFIVLFTLLAVWISEFTSNTASANLIVPICIAVCQSASIHPYKPVLAATLASSLGFMLPISTAPNAIVFGSGLIKLQTMIRYGVVLDIIGAILVALGVYWLA